MGAAGYVDRDRAVVLFAPNIAWRDVDLRAELEERVGLPVVIENDANAAAWGEFPSVPAIDIDDLLMVTVGTGVGGGMVLDGVAVPRRRSGWAPRSGTCGSCPTACSAAAATAAASSSTPAARPWCARPAPRRAATAARGRTCSSGPAATPTAIDGPLVTQAARRRRPVRRRAQLAELGRWLGEGIASLAAVLDPAVVVIGGGVSEAGDLLLDPGARGLRRPAHRAAGHRPVPDIRTARLGNRAGMIGAADLARR